MIDEAKREFLSLCSNAGVGRWIPRGADLCQGEETDGEPESGLLRAT